MFKNPKKDRTSIGGLWAEVFQEVVRLVGEPIKEKVQISQPEIEKVVAQSMAAHFLDPRNPGFNLADEGETFGGAEIFFAVRARVVSGRLFKKTIFPVQKHLQPLFYRKNGGGLFEDFSEC